MEGPGREAATGAGRSGPVELVLRLRYVFLTAVALLSCAQHVSGTGKDWSYFVEGSELLFGVHHGYSVPAGGLHVYANYPTLQIGPLTFLVATPLRLLGPDDGRVASAFLMSAFVVGLVFVLERAAIRVWGADRRDGIDFRSITVLLGGMLVAQSWASLSAIYAHLDDVLTLGAGVGAIWGVAARRPVWVGVFAGLAVAAKPWGVVALPLVLACEGAGKLRALAVAASVTALAWLPFVLADSRTLDSVTPKSSVSPESVLHLFGVHGAFGPSWTRPVQLVVILAVGTLAVWRGRWEAALFVGVAARLLLDPQTFLYYTAGLVIAALAWDLLRTRRPLPVWTFVCFVLLNDAHFLVPDSTTRSVLRLVLFVGAIAIVLFGPRGRAAVDSEPASQSSYRRADSS